MNNHKTNEGLNSQIKRDPLNIKVKFDLPPPRANLVSRQRLFDKLNNGLQAGRSLTLISAPAGYGKSVLAAEWIRDLQKSGKNIQASWISLDHRDNNPEQFFAYLTELLLEKPFDGALRFTYTGEEDSLPESLTTVLDDIIIHLFASRESMQTETEIESSPTQLMVLDDYHQINAEVIHRSVQYLLDHFHPNLHIIIIARNDPPLNLSRLRAHSELTEIRMRDLAFHLPEAAELLSNIVEAELKEEWISDLTERTEGWAVGLQLAAVSLKQSTNIKEFIKDFRGSHRYLVDYLVDEVLKSQPVQVRDFLIQTSILKCFNEELSSLITGKDLSNNMLSRIEKANLFLIPLDDDRNWYRYHHLFADCLKRQITDDDKKRIFIIASTWSEKKGYIVDAVEYALATGDYNIAADTLERALKNPAIWSLGYLTMLEGWFAKLPPDCVNCRPDLQIMASRALYLSGKIEEAEQLLDQGEQLLERNPPDNIELTESLKVQIDIYRASIAAMKGEVARARELVKPVLGRLSPSMLHVKAQAFDTVGLVEELAGYLEQSLEAYLKASSHASKAGVLYLAINALCEAAMIKLTEGNLSEAKKICQDALNLTGDDQQNLPPAGLAWAMLGEIDREENNLELAEMNNKKGLELALSGGIIDDLRHIYFFQFQLQMSDRYYKALTDAEGSATRVLDSYRIKRLNQRAEAIKARASLLKGDLYHAKIWAEKFDKYYREQRFEYIIDFELLTLIRVKLASHLINDSLALCEKVINAALSGGRKRTAMEALILHSMASWNTELKKEAENSLGQALAMAAPDKYSRLFIDEGPELKKIIEIILPTIKEQPIKSFCQSIIDAFDAEQTPEVNPERLSLQEIKVLEMIALGLSNKVIAEKLFISPGTVKWHAHNIYEKLDVGSRTQAVAKARELKIIKLSQKD